MNKAVVKKLDALNELFSIHEEAVENNFTAKQVAIFRYRVGADEGKLHQLKEVAKHFKCSVAYVTRISRDISDFLAEMSKGKKVAPESSDDDKESKIAILSATIIDGKIKVKHEDPEKARELEEALQGKLDGMFGSMDRIGKEMKLAEEARVLGNTSATKNRFMVLFAAIAAILSGLLAVYGADLTELQSRTTLAAIGFSVFTWLVLYIQAVSYLGRHLGILNALRVINNIK